MLLILVLSPIAGYEVNIDPAVLIKEVADPEPVGPDLMFNSPEMVATSLPLELLQYAVDILHLQNIFFCDRW